MTHGQVWLLALWSAALAAAAAPLSAAPAGTAPVAPADAGAFDFFEKHVRPVLAERCYGCHSAAAKKVKGRLLLDTREGLLRGGENGPAVVPGDPDKSLLVRAVRYSHEDLQMPPKEPLTKAQVAAFEQWVKAGAPDPRAGGEGAVAAPPPAPSYDFDKAKQFWSFRPVREPALPAVGDAGAWCRNDVDRFLLAKMEARGVRPVAAADRRALLRRATYDLTGLPPTPEEVDAFEKDPSPRAFEGVVDRLLASPAYGEKWGRHWLDVVRYADTSGCNSDFPVPEAFRYRNWVIDSFNRDAPYDQFLKEQLAGDLLPAADDKDRRDKIVATGYLAVARRFGSRGADTYLTIEDTIDNVGKAMLGLSVSCARCHDHKFDPVQAADYYALYGIFNSTKYAFPGTEIYRHTKDFVPLGPAADAQKLSAWEGKLADLDDRSEKVLRESMALESIEKQARDLEAKAAAKRAATGDGWVTRVRPQVTVDPKDELKAGAKPEAKSEAKTETKADAAKEVAPAAPAYTRSAAEAKAELFEIKRDVEKLEAAPPPVEKAYAAQDGKAADAKVQIKGDPKTPGPLVPRGFLTVLGGQKLPPEEKGSGRRELADWIACKDNSLTARVMVNRIWQGHFGAGLVKTPNDFGARGERPTHPELLDYLAARFVAGGWSVKSMHRLLMLSQAYRTACADDPSDAALDPGNELHWRFEPRRLSAEEVRDSILAAAGALDRTPGGPHPFPPAAEWRYTQHKPFAAAYALYDTPRRSVYLMQQRLRRHPLLATFDGADPNATTPSRPLSTTAVQALWMMNDPLLHDCADKLAVRVGLAAGETDGRVAYAYRLLLGRGPSDEESSDARDYLARSASKLAEAGLPWDQRTRAALGSFARVLMGTNEFLFVE